MEVGTQSEWVDLANGAGADCHAIFHMEAVENKFETQKQGRPIFNDVPFVKVLIPGDKTSVVDRKVKDEDKVRWSAQWERFQAGQAEAVSGTPIETWPLLNKSQVATMKALNILTIEALAELSDTGLGKIGMGARDLQKRARQHLSPQAEVVTDLRSELAEVKADKNALAAQLQEAVRRIAALEGGTAPIPAEATAPAPKRRGRPPKGG